MAISGRHVRESPQLSHHRARSLYGFQQAACATLLLSFASFWLA